MITHPKILIVDDEEGIRESLASILRDERYSVETVPSAEEALERITKGDVQVILLDIWLPGIDGMEALSRIQTGRMRWYAAGIAAGSVLFIAIAIFL